MTEKSAGEGKFIAQGIFISLEGPDGAGKTTQMTLLGKHLEEKGYNVLFTREPGGTVIGEAIRAILLDPGHGEMASRTEALLYAAARAQHVVEVIKPALKAGKIVLCDRYVDSTYAYQGYGRGLDLGFLSRVNEAAMNGIKPDLTIILDLPPSQGKGRLRQRVNSGGPDQDRLEQENLAFHQRVREGFLALAEEEPGRCKVFDGRQGINLLHEQIKEQVEENLGGTP